jgi:hypothetical protein
MNLEDIKTLRLLLSQLDERVDLIEGEATEVADLVLEFNLAKNDMGIVYDRLVGLLGDLMIEDPIIELRDGAQVERKIASSRKGWQHKDLAGVVMDRIVQSSVDMDTGEVISTPKEMAMQMLDYLAPSYWRVGKLNEIGVTADLYCEPSEPKTSVIVRKGEAQ